MYKHQFITILIILYFYLTISYISGDEIQVYSSCKLKAIGNNDINGYVLFLKNGNGYDMNIVLSGKNIGTTLYSTIREFGDLNYQDNYVLGYNEQTPYNCSAVIGCLGEISISGDKLNTTIGFNSSYTFTFEPNPSSGIGRVFALSTSPNDQKDIVAQCVLGIGNPTFVPFYSPFSRFLNSSTVNQAAYRDFIGNSLDQGAICYMEGTTHNPNLNGTVWLTTRKNLLENSGINIVANINGLDTSSRVYGFHINEFGDILATTGPTTGNDWGLANQTHGLPPAANRHYGDLGNICSYFNDVGYYNWTTGYIPYSDSLPNLIGRSMVLLANADYGTSNGTSSGNVIIGQCVIGIRQDNNLPMATKFNPNTNNSNPTCLSNPTESPTVTVSPTVTPTPSSSSSIYPMVGISILVILLLIIL